MIDGYSRFLLIQVKTKRAAKHLRDLQAEAEIHRDVYEYVVIEDANSEGQRDFHKLPVSDFSVIACAGDVIHNLRSALDHLAWHLVQAAGNTPTKGCGFPIAESWEDFESVKIRRMAGMAPQAKNAIEALQPYKGANGPLWKLHSLDIVDKHRELLVVGNKYLYSSSHFFDHFLSKHDEPADFPGIFATDTSGDNRTTLSPTLPKTKIDNIQPLIPELQELLIFTDDLIKDFLPLLG